MIKKFKIIIVRCEIYFYIIPMMISNKWFKVLLSFCYEQYTYNAILCSSLSILYSTYR